MYKGINMLKYSFLLSCFCITNLQAAEVVLYFDSGYVDTAEEAANLQASLVNNGDTVTTLTGTSGVFAAALVGKDMLVFPEQQNGNLITALDAPTQTSIFNFVHGGGIMVVHGGSTPKDVNLINGLFGYSLTTNGSASGSSTLSAVASAGDFKGAPASLDNLSATTRVAKATIAAIPNSTVVYEADATYATVFSVNIGSGKLIFMGWDWYDAAPQGSAGGSWLSTYEFVSKKIAVPAPVSGSASGLTW
ncbi:hypothetical protein Q4519_09580 [Motilimonas sp. 1_MG-2023]|uniref:hypothetical protein n=1 Tax=Motilimonas sp. 1_MG-2023 TaxID=3062672 RepID=UPI0026E12E38|nr:hypothetical protein [Motilimonas sp. 1_MG-2023]MDO6525928.1 hypothetical protein [Motilimonas sp. 1_MG-2023]